MKTLIKAAAFCALGMTSTLAVAIPTDYTFNVSLGAIGGPSRSAPAFVTLDGVTGSGIETFTANTGNLLKFDFIFSGYAFSITDEDNYPSLPSVRLQDGLLTGVEYTGGTGPFLGGRINPRARITLTEQTNSVFFWNGSPQGTIRFGQVAPQSWRSIPSPVPSPATLALFALGLAGLGIHRAIRLVNNQIPGNRVRLLELPVGIGN